MSTDIAPHQHGQLEPARPIQEAPEGLEDFEVVATIPRIKVQHKLGLFEAPDTSTAPEIVGVFLGLVVRRTLFQAKLEDGAPVRCKSTDGKVGFPTINAEKPKWNLNFDLVGHAPLKHADGRSVFQCASCKLGQWVDDDAPLCHKSYEVPIMFSLHNPGQALPTVDELEYSGILTVKKSWLSKFNGYVNPFAQSKRSLFTALTRVSLTTAQRGDNVYCLPNFTRVGTTDEEMHDIFRTNFRAVAEILRRPPRNPEDEASSGAVIDSSASDGDPWADQDPWADTPATPAPASTTRPSPAQPATPPPAATPSATTSATPTASVASNLSNLSDDEIPF